MFTIKYSEKKYGRLLALHSVHLNNNLDGGFNTYDRLNPSTTSFLKQVCKLATPCFYSRLAMLCSEESMMFYINF